VVRVVLSYEPLDTCTDATIDKITSVVDELLKHVAAIVGGIIVILLLLPTWWWVTCAPDIVVLCQVLCPAGIKV
jgi:hypothetical protein